MRTIQRFLLSAGILSSTCIGVGCSTSAPPPAVSEDGQVPRVGASPVEESTPEPTLTLGGEVTYDATESWCISSPDELLDPRYESLRQLLESDTPVGVVVLSDGLRIYNLTGRWRPVTLSVLDDAEQPTATVRMDLPPTGVVRSPLPDQSEQTDGQILVRMIEPITPEGLVHVNRHIGTPAAEFTTQNLRELDFGEQVPVSGESHELRTLEWGVRVTVGIWQCVALGDHSSFAAHHSGDEGQAPPEVWWAEKVAEAFQSLESNAAALEESVGETE